MKEEEGERKISFLTSQYQEGRPIKGVVA